MSKRYLFFDTETASFTGPILQLAYIFTDENGVTIACGHPYFCHDFEYEIEESAFKVHGLTKAHLAEHGYKKEAIVDCIARFCDKFFEADVIVAHNAPFDVRMISKDRERYFMGKLPLLERGILFCTMWDSKIAAFVNAKDKNGKIKNPSMSELYFRLFGEPIKNVHSAHGDVKALRDCFFELKRRKIIDI